VSRGAAGTLDLGRLRALADTSDVDLGVVLLRGTPTNQARTPEALRRISARAQQFGRDLAGRTRASGSGSGSVSVSDDDLVAPGAHGMTVVEHRDGLRSGDPAVALFSHRTRTIDLYLDTVEFCEDLVDRLDWRSWFAAGSVRDAAIAHERAHDLISHAHARDLRVAVGEAALTVGRWHRWAHVAGADELAAHAYAQAVLGLGRSPLLVTAAAATALDQVHRPVKES
jgi:hypothetical protein